MRFYFDYVSPYAYLASTRIRDVAARHGRVVEPVPVLFAGMLTATGNVGPAEIEAKRRHMQVDVERIAQMLGVPIEPPAVHPFNPLVPLRATASIEDPRARWDLVDRLFRAVWVESQRIDALDLPVAAGAKERLRANTDEALAAGAFGVPTVAVDGELFWGVDALPRLDRFLAGELRVDAERLARWRAVAPSATRPR